MLSAVFLDGCVTVHDYKNKINALGKNAKSKIFNYQIAECYILKYEDFIYLCNHLDERRTFFKSKVADGDVLRATLFYSTHADKALLVYTKKNGIAESVAVLYNAGKKVEDRSSSHRARDLRAAEKRWQKNCNQNNPNQKRPIRMSVFFYAYQLKILFYYNFFSRFWIIEEKFNKF